MQEVMQWDSDHNEILTSNSKIFKANIYGADLRVLNAKGLNVYKILYLFPLSLITVAKFISYEIKNGQPDTAVKFICIHS